MSNADLRATTEASGVAHERAIPVERGLSAFGCSNVANLLQWALDALELNDIGRAQSAVTMAAEIALFVEGGGSVSGRSRREPGAAVALGTAT